MISFILTDFAILKRSLRIPKKMHNFNFFLALALCPFWVLSAASADISLLRVQLPETWKSTNNAKLFIESCQLRIQSPVRLGGCHGLVQIIPGQRYIISGQMRGEGKAAAGINGSSGWAYSQTLVLNAQWQDFSISYYEDKELFSFDLFSTSDAQTTFEIRNLAIAVLPIPELYAVEIPARLFLAFEHPGSNGRVETKAGAYKRMAVWGKRWYCAVHLPVPTSSQPIYYYANLYKDSEHPIKVHLLYDKQQVLAESIFTAQNSWHWVRLGPISAAAAYPEVILHYNGDPATQIWVDKIILSTNAELNPAILNSME